MPTKFQTGAGDKVKLFVSLLPLGERMEPMDIPLTTSGATIDVASPSFTIATSLTATEMIAAGTPIEFTWTHTYAAGHTGDVTAVVFVASDTSGTDTIPIDETILPLEVATPIPVPVGTPATVVAKQRLLGGTSTGATIGADRTESTVFEDPLGYKDGLITSQNWEIPWTANLLADDLAYRRVYFASINAVEGRELYVWQEDPPPSGYTTGDTIKGAAVVTNFSKDFPSDGIITFNCTFSGQGAPVFSRYS